MDHINFEKLTEMGKKAQEPFQELAALGVQTLQNINYVKPGDVKSPEELVEQQIKVAVENGHLALDYLQKSFRIVEKAMLSAVQDVKKKTEAKH
ncbi:phasin family protein [Legionella dresdenensis]|uniref:Phasin family protein n=1 Tax=Legionella dresdenensis TaxID=450200 RepID=A0ABV8CES3_9GAMM